MLIVTSQGGVLDAADVAAGADPLASTPGPAMAPVAGRFFAERDAGADIGDRRRHRRHELRRQPGAPRPHPLDARDVAGPSRSRAT